MKQVRFMAKKGFEYFVTWVVDRRELAVRTDQDVFKGTFYESFTEAYDVVTLLGRGWLVIEVTVQEVTV